MFWSSENFWCLCIFLEFSGLFYCSIIKLPSSVSACFLLTRFCVSEIYIITLFWSCQHFFSSFFIFLQTLVFQPFCRKDSLSEIKTLLHLQLLLSVKSTVWCNSLCNGEGGIWTLAPLLTTYSLSRGAPSASWVLLQADSIHISKYRITFRFHYSQKKIARYQKWFRAIITERVGFEPTRPCGQTVFKTASLWPLRYLSTYFVVAFCLSQTLLDKYNIRYDPRQVFFWFFSKKK